MYVGFTSLATAPQMKTAMHGPKQYSSLTVEQKSHVGPQCVVQRRGCNTTSIYHAIKGSVIPMEEFHVTGYKWNTSSIEVTNSLDYHSGKNIR